ncbi:MAG: hypothetical protein EPO11_02075 [Gammaproteobacteria bacterium]|nr:MAG: hypothetical protein EPO11_02075 [Gammaproteobacteria bacterium]
MKLSSFTMKCLAASLILASSTGVAFAKAKNYKGESYKDEIAVPCPPPKMLMDGFYLGGQVGYDSWKVRENVNTPGTSNITAFTANPQIAENAWLGGLFLGYGQYLTDLFYLGGEIFANYENSNSTWSAQTATPAASYQSKFETNASYGLAFLPGLRVNDATLGYIRLGWNWAHLKAVENTSRSTGSDSTSDSNTSNGFNFGVGMETLVYQNWSVRGEFAHTWYNSFTTNFDTKYNPSDNLYTLGVIYHFG